MQDGKGRSAIHWACRHGKTHLVNLLLKADPHLAGILNKKRETCLLWAAVGGHADIVALLLKACPFLTKLKDRQGNTALHYAYVSFYSNSTVCGYLN
jgi:ankyrin repeat protein